MSLPKFKSCGKSCILLAFSWCLSFLLSTAKADTVDTILRELQNNVSPVLLDINQDTGLLVDQGSNRNKLLGQALTGRNWDATSGQTASPLYTNKDNMMYYLRALLTVMYGSSRPDVLNWNGTTLSDRLSTLHTDNQDLYSLLLNFSNLLVSASAGTNMITVNLTNIVQLASGTNIFNGPISPDILAGNPWWNTNSAFEVAWDYWTSTMPYPAAKQGLSFPEAFSALFSSINRNTVGFNIGDWGGQSRIGSASINGNEGFGYTWFDWMADVMKSNLSVQAQMLYKMPTNQAPAQPMFTNILHAEDILAGNPWWYTNSVFAQDIRGLSAVSPHADKGSPYVSGSFPEVLSWYLSMRNAFVGDVPTHDDFWDRWGWGGKNVQALGEYAFEDFLADVLKSNLVALAGVSATNGLAGSEDPYSTDNDVKTNSTPLPEYVLEKKTIEDPGYGEKARSSMEGIINSVQPGTSSNPEIVIIPEMDIGGVHVQEYRASLDYPQVTSVAHAVCSFLWRVMAATGIFVLMSIEWVYYTSLGHTEGKG